MPQAGVNDNDNVAVAHAISTSPLWTLRKQSVGTDGGSDVAAFVAADGTLDTSLVCSSLSLDTDNDNDDDDDNDTAINTRLLCVLCRSTLSGYCC